MLRAPGVDRLAEPNTAAQTLINAFGHTNDPLTITSFVLGILSVVLPFLAAPGFAFGVVGLSRNGGGRALGIAGVAVSTLMGVLTAFGAVAYIILLTALFVLSPPPELEEETGGVAADSGAEADASVEGEQRYVADVEPGECIVHRGGVNDPVQNVTVVPCDVPHTDEVFGAFDLTGVWEGDDAAGDAGHAGCAELFDAAMAQLTSAPSHELDFWFVYPGKENWDWGDREVTCMVFDTRGTDVAGQVFDYPIEPVGTDV